MKTRIVQCNINYESWQMQCCGDPIHVGQVVNLSCIKDKPYTCACGIVDRFAGTGRHIDNPDNTFSIIDVQYIDGWECPDCYGHRKGDDASFYIITLEDAVECMLDSYDRYPMYQGLYVKMEPDDDSNNIFWDEGGSEMGTIDELTIYKDEKSRNIDLTDYSWHHDLVEWHEFYQRNIHEGYKNINNTEWLKWWSKGWGLAKDVEMDYGHSSQSIQVLYGEDLNTTSFRISFPKHMQNRINEGLFIPYAYVDWEKDDDENNNYMFELNGFEHDIHPDDRVMLGVLGRSQYQTGTVIQCKADELLIRTDWPLDISESYSIELIV